ncbi:8-oxoguanine DNA glycosylase OGG fold protein [Micromonospora sp. BQ11]|uniref:8-oxoguanine DNA glycosylase OGG fold protein n=1 Tax=Micromonospora sp. BQ11 TaxID=3452212 RepID=UPI003F8C4333
MSLHDGPALPGEPAPITVHTDRWRATLPADAWPTGFPETGAVWRRDVFAVVDAWRDGAASPRQLLAAVLMWGYGPIGYGPWRAARSLQGDPDGSRLTHALDGIAAATPDEEALRTAYRRFRDPAESRLPWLGPAFFTKLLYFAGYKRDAEGLRPLILDRVVANRLPAEAGVRRRSGWLSEEWLAYLRWANTQAEARGLQPDEVEMALFHDRWPPSDADPAGGRPAAE